MNMQGIAKFFDQNMMYLIALSILSGAAVGWFAPEFSKGLKAHISLTLVMLAINPLIQMPVMAWILRWSPNVFRREKAIQ